MALSRTKPACKHWLRWFFGSPNSQLLMRVASPKFISSAFFRIPEMGAGFLGLFSIPFSMLFIQRARYLFGRK